MYNEASELWWGDLLMVILLQIYLMLSVPVNEFSIFDAAKANN